MNALSRAGDMPEPAHHVIRDEEHRAAVDAAGEADADRRAAAWRVDPLLQPLARSSPASAPM